MDTPANPLSLARSRLLLPAGLDPSGLDRMLGTLLGPGIDFGDIYFQHSRRESWSVEDGIVKDGAHSIEQGVGVRAISGEKTGFAYSDDINGEALLEAANSARAIARDGTTRMRSEEHTSELQSRPHLVCRLLLEKKKKKK